MTAISDYEIFTRVVNAGNMSAAGRELGLSPAVISKRISHLEKRLGSRLLQRTTRQLKLTETGEEFYRRVVHILNGIEEAEAFVSRRNAAARGTLRISAPTLFARLHIAPFLDEFLGLYPELKISVDVTDEFVDIIQAGYDVAVRVGDLKDSSLVARRLAPNRKILCAAPAYLRKVGEPRNLDELMRHRLLTYSMLDPWRLTGPEGLTTVKVESRFHTNSNDVVRAALLAGAGISLRPLWDIGPELKNGKVKRILRNYEGDLGTGIFAVYPCREFLPEKLKVFLDFLGSKYGSSPYWERDLDLDNEPTKLSETQ